MRPTTNSKQATTTKSFYTAGSAGKAFLKSNASHNTVIVTVGLLVLRGSSSAGPTCFLLTSMSRWGWGGEGNLTAPASDNSPS